MAYNPYGNSDAYDPTLAYKSKKSTPVTATTKTIEDISKENVQKLLATQNKIKAKSPDNKKDINETIKTVLSGNIPSGILPKESAFKKFYKNFKGNNTKPNIYDFFKNTKDFGSAIKKGIDEKILGKKEITDIANSYPEMAGVFANYLPGLGVKPLITPKKVDVEDVPVIPGTITTPGLSDSSELVNQQQDIVPVISGEGNANLNGDSIKKEDEEASDVIDEISGDNEPIEKEKSDKLKKNLKQQESVAIENAKTPEQKNNIMKYFNKLQNEITRRTISQLKAGKEQALLGLGQAQAALTPQYESQRARAATTSMQQARNFGEYLAARGQSTSGLAAQAELSRGTGLTRQLGEIGQQEQAAQDQLNANKAKIQSDFQLAIANAKSDAEIAKLNQALAQAMKQEDRAYSESIYQRNKKDAEIQLANDRKYNEMIANKNRALQLGDLAAAQQYEKDIINFKAQVELNLAKGKAALQPASEPKAVEYDYRTDPDFGIELQDLLTGDKEQIKQNYALLIANSAAYIDKFDYAGYNELKKQMESLKDSNGLPIFGF